MASNLRTRRQKRQPHPFVVMGLIVLLIVLIAFALAVHWFGWDWTGFTSATGPTLKPNEQYRPAKTLWDWLQLLIIPILLAIGGYWLSQMQKMTEQRSMTDNQREAALQAYIDKISELRLKEHLDELTADGQLKPEYDQIRKIARVRTITILFQLDARRIGYVFAFLREAGLMSNKPNSSIVSLRDANLRGVTLSKATLYGANLSGALLGEADLSEAFLREADLSEAFLREANLSEAILFRANLNRANLSFANLSGALLGEADLSEAFLGGANFSEAHLHEANLRSANLSKATLSKATLIQANFRDAILNHANLRDAIVSVPELEEQAKSLQGTTMPDGSEHP